jgi:MFS family permease
LSRTSLPPATVRKGSGLAERPGRSSTAPAELDRATLPVASVVVVGAIMSILDTTIVNVALATLGRELHASLSTIQWVSSGYLVALAVVIPMTGWATERFGSKRLWMVVVGLFVIGSALSGLAWSAARSLAPRSLEPRPR